jgi:hypothetical protein
MYGWQYGVNVNKPRRAPGNSAAISCDGRLAIALIALDFRPRTGGDRNRLKLAQVGLFARGGLANG